MRLAMITTAGLMALAFGVAGCKPAPEAVEPASAPAQTPATPIAPLAAAAPPVVATVGAFEPLSTTASGITGDLILTADGLTFAKDQSYVTAAPALVEATAPTNSSGDSWASVLMVPADAKIEVRAVTAETVGSKAPNGGLCAPARTTFIGLVAGSDATGGKNLKLAAFKGARPDIASGPTDLCGTFMYAPKGG